MDLAEIVISLCLVALTYMIIRMIRSKIGKSEEALELRKRAFPHDVKGLISLYMFGHIFRREAELTQAALYSNDKILESIGLKDFTYYEPEDVLRAVRAAQPPIYVLRVIQANVNLLNKIKEKAEDRRILIDTVFGKVFPKLNFEEWNKMDYSTQRRLIREILGGMELRCELRGELRGELKQINNSSTTSEENLIAQ